MSFNKDKLSTKATHGCVANSYEVDLNYEHVY
jgi:hypothetical protein